MLPKLQPANRGLRNTDQASKRRLRQSMVDTIANDLVRHGAGIRRSFPFSPKRCVLFEHLCQQQFRIDVASLNSWFHDYLPIDPFAQSPPPLLVEILADVAKPPGQLPQRGISSYHVAGKTLAMDFFQLEVSTHESMFP